MATAALAGTAPAEEGVSLSERLPANTPYKVELTTEISGRMTVPTGRETAPRVVAVVGKGTLQYDERGLPPEDAETLKSLRFYRKVEIQRSIDGREQRADIRKEVRRLVILHSARGKSPFSPDGPLTWNEIDVVKNDVFVPILIAGLLPAKAVKPADHWDVTAEAVRDLTDIEKVTAGALTVTYVGPVKIRERDHARLTIAGSVRGIDDNGPCRHTLDGTAYVDLAAGLLTYLSVKGTHDLLDGAGKVVGTIEGRFTLHREATASADLADGIVAKLDTKPSAANTQLLYDNPDLGVKFVHPRRWRVGAVQGTQVTLDGPNGAGVLLTREPRDRLPTAAAFLKESQEFLRKEKATLANINEPRQLTDTTETFGFDADLAGEKLRMEYAVVSSPTGGATVAARLPRSDVVELAKDVEGLLKGLVLTKASK